MNEQVPEQTAAKSVSRRVPKVGSPLDKPARRCKEYSRPADHTRENRRGKPQCKKRRSKQFHEQCAPICLGSPALPLPSHCRSVGQFRPNRNAVFAWGEIVVYSRFPDRDGRGDRRERSHQAKDSPSDPTSLSAVPPYLRRLHRPPRPAFCPRSLLGMLQLPATSANVCLRRHRNEARFASSQVRIIESLDFKYRKLKCSGRIKRLWEIAFLLRQPRAWRTRLRLSFIGSKLASQFLG